MKKQKPKYTSVTAMINEDGSVSIIARKPDGNHDYIPMFADGGQVTKIRSYDTAEFQFVTE